MIGSDAVHQLLAACAIAPAGSELPRDAWTRALQSRESLLAAARQHQLRPQLAAGFARHRLESGATAWGELEAAARAYEGHGLLMAAELARVLVALRTAGIRAVPFKGPAAAVFFGAGPRMREMCDLDVVIDGSRIRAAVGALEHLGYVPNLAPHVIDSPWLRAVTNELGLSALENATFVELHWRFAPPFFPVCVEPGEVLEEAVARDFFGTDILWPRPEELLLLHVTDGIKSGGGSIRWMGDLAAIVRASPLDWARLRGVAARNGGLDALRVALAVLEGLVTDLARAWEGLELLALPREACSLAREAREQPRLRTLVSLVRRRLDGDCVLRGRIAHFHWALRTSDQGAGTPGRIAAHLLGPSLTDLALMPPRGCSDTRLRFRAMRRRLGGA